MPHMIRRAGAATILLAGLTVAASCGVAATDEAEPMADIATARVNAENGVDRLAPGEAVEAVLEAIRGEGTFHVTGVMGGLQLDIRYDVGTGAVGAIGDPTDESRPVEMLALDGRIYVSGDEDFLVETVGEDAAKTIGGKWLLLAEDTTERFDVLASGEKFAKAILPGDGESLDITGVREVDGVPAIGLIFQDTGATLWVAATGNPVPVRLEEKGASGGTGVLTFSEIGAEVELHSPEDDEVVDAANLADADADGEGEDDDA